MNATIGIFTDGYPCKNMDTILDRLRRARYISKIDLKSAYHQVCLDDDSKAYTAFSVQGSGQYQFLRLPFGLKCAPMTFQRLMDSLFGAEVEPYVFAYLDDIFWSQKNVRRACELARTSHTHFIRCQARSEPRQMRILCCQSVQFLGYVLDSSGLRIDSERVRPIHDYPTPRNVKQVRRLLGMVGWYSRFIKNEAEIKVPLARLLRKDTPFVWGADQEQAFATLKQSLSEAPVLVRPDFDKEFAIQTDASDYAIGAVLTQEREDDRTERPYDEEGVDRPWAVVAADMMEFPRSKNQNKYLLVFQDLFTRWIEIVPLRKANGVNVLRAFEELVLFRWETPEFLLTDNGKEFDNAVVNTALEEYGVKHIFTPPYYPSANVVERSNRTIKTMIACYVGDKHDEWSATPTRSNGVRLPPLSGEQPEGLHRQSGRRWTSERGGVELREKNASEEARASQEAVAELNEYVRLMELGVPARLRPEPEGRAVVEVSGELIPVFARPSMHASEDAMDWEESVQPGNYSWQRPAWQQRTDADRRRASRQRRQASGVGTRQRTPSPGEGRRPNGGGEPLLEEETRAMLEQLVAARQPVEEWDGEAFEEVFRGSPEEEVLLLEEGEATATLRRSGETDGGKRGVPTPPLAPVQGPSALPLPPPVQQVSYVAGLHGLVFQPFAVQQQRLPQTEYPLDGQQQRQLRRPGPYQEQQQHRQLPRRQPQQHQREEVRVEVRPLSPVAGPSSLSGNTAAPARIRGENFGGLEPVGFVPGLDPPRGACFECHEPGHTRRQCRKPYNGDLCTNCGRRGVKVRHCPRCSRGWKKSQRNFHSKRAAARKQLWKALGGGRC
ncbi:unnamed protein product [Trichogramma brassicae]|uniref:RNA-directed DNA polymerase n=1 Tax=Trichogramma brassicae TaxID=86971 RepID=A0A6H5ITM6_9HYME|nr:unnamed protein product [Trichogramma brassicae]